MPMGIVVSDYRALLVGGLGLVILLVSIGVGISSWIGVGIAYLLAASVFRRLRAAGRAVTTRHGIGIAVGTVALASVMVGFGVSSDHSPITAGFWDVLVNDLVLTVVVAVVTATGVTDDRRHRVAGGLAVALLLGIVIGETILTSLPYDADLTLVDHLVSRVAYRVRVLVGGVMSSVPIVLLLQGVPDRIDRLLTIGATDE